MPIQSPSGFVQLPTCVPPQVEKNAGLLIFAWRPLQPPTLTSPTTTIGMRPARMTKNCMTSL